MTDGTLTVRADRKTEVAQERRRRDDTSIDGGQRLNLAIPPAIKAKLDAQGLTPRWVNDTGNRIEQLTIHDDYDRVEDVEPVTVDIDRSNGVTAKAYLLAKRTDFLAEDAAKRDAKRREAEAAMLDPNAVGARGQYLVEGSTIQSGARRASP